MPSMNGSSCWLRLATVMIAAFYLIAATVSAVPMRNDVELVPMSGRIDHNKGTEAFVWTTRPTNENEGWLPNSKVFASRPTIPLNTDRGASALAPSRGLTIITPTRVDAKASAVGRQASTLAGRTRTASKLSSSNTSVRRPAVRGAPPSSNGQLSSAFARQAGQSRPTGLSRTGGPIRSPPRQVWNRKTGAPPPARGTQTGQNRLNGLSRTGGPTRTPQGQAWNRKTITPPPAKNTRASGPSTTRPSVPSSAVPGRTRATLPTGRARQSSAPARSVALSSTTVIDQRASGSVASKLKQDQKADRSILQQDPRVERARKLAREELVPSLMKYVRGDGSRSDEEKVRSKMHEALEAVLASRSRKAADILPKVLEPFLQSHLYHDVEAAFTQLASRHRAGGDYSQMLEKAADIRRMFADTLRDLPEKI